MLPQTSAQPPDSLFAILKAKDSLLFNVGFNQCKVEAFEQLVSEDFEFYHDKSGPTLGKRDFIESIRNGLCQLNYTAIRRLDHKSLQVFPLAKNGVLYGAIQSGRHRFYERSKDGTERSTSVALFTHLWRIEKGEWKFSRGLSFDHQPVIID